MIVRYSILLCALALIFFSPPSFADEAQDALVELGVAAYDDGDYERAKNILLPLAEAGHPKAMVMIGLLHDGTPAFPNDPKTECDWYERAGNAGSSAGMYNLSICYNQGIGRDQNKSEMLRWRTNAAAHGSTNAMINLSALDPDKGEEYRHWMMMAQDHGSAFARVSLWLRGYKSDSQMNFRDLVCVSWNILIMDKSKKTCD